MRRTSEFAALGHPDKGADYISSYILDRHLEIDPATRFAVEVQVKDNFVTLGGEVSSEARFDADGWRRMAAEAVAEIGYTHGYAERWGEGNALDASRLDVAVHVGMQSPDIAQGVDRGGWGDQGIFWGMATSDPATGFMPPDIWIAAGIGRELFASGAGGIDIKTQVTTVDGAAAEVVVAIPALPAEEEAVEAAARAVALKWAPDAAVVVNGTGRFVRHSSWGDCGTTGRKLAVDFYGGNCRIGGGSPWTKDGSKADVALNLLARRIALERVRRTGGREARCSISSCIGRRGVAVCVYDEAGREAGFWRDERPASEIVRELGLRLPRYAEMCREGLFKFVDGIE